MRSDTSTVGFLLFAVLILLFFSSCGNEYTNEPFDYASRPFEAYIIGKIDELETEAVVSYLPGADGELVSVRFSAPKALSGITVTRACDGSVSARLGDMAVESSGFEGLLEPFIFICGCAEYSSIYKNDDNDTVIKATDSERELTYLFKSGESHPYLLCGSTDKHDFELELSFQN